MSECSIQHSVIYHKLWKGGEFPPLFTSFIVWAPRRYCFLDIWLKSHRDHWYLVEIPQRSMIDSGISRAVGPLDAHIWKHKGCDIFPNRILRNTGSGTDQQVGWTIFWGGMDWMIFPDVWKLLCFFSNEGDLLLKCRARWGMPRKNATDKFRRLAKLPGTDPLQPGPSRYRQRALGHHPPL